MSLGDQLPAEQRRQLARQALVPGALLHLFCNFLTPPKYKFLLLGCAEPEPVLFAINSRVSRYITARQHLAECQVMLYRNDHSFLAYDSFLDCTTAIRDFTLDNLVEQLATDFRNSKDKLSAKDREAVIKAVSQAVTLEERVKKWVLRALTEV